MRFMNTLVCAGLLLLASASISAQQPEILWDRTIGGNYADALGSILPSPDGDGWYLFGSSSSSAGAGEKTAPPYTLFGTDIWIVKYNSNWEKQWDKVIGGTKEESLTGVLRTSDGGFLLGATSFSDKSGDKSEDTRGTADSDYWIVKIDAAGNVLWDKTIGGADLDDLDGMYYHPNGGYLLTGTSYSGKSGEKSHDSYGKQDIWAVHVDENGTKVWDMVYGGSKFDLAGGIFPYYEGFILTGKSDSPVSGNKTSTPRGSFDGWMIMIDLAGNHLWDRCVGGSDNEGSIGISHAHDGGYMLSITSKSDISGDKTTPDVGNNDAWFVKMDSDWNIEWDVTIGTVHQDNLSAGRSYDGGYLLRGVYNEQEQLPGGNLIDHGVRWMIQCDDKLNQQWEYKFGGEKNEIGGPTWIMQDDSSTILMGSSSDSPISGQKTEASRGGRDFWIVKMKLPNGIYTGIEPKISPLQISIFPNPVSDGLVVFESVEESISSVELYDIGGKILSRYQGPADKQVRMNVGELSKGLYLARIRTSAGRYSTHKLIIQ